MVYWEKSDGGLILITFTRALIGTVTGQESHFSVTWQEYNYVPGGSLVNKTGSVTATYPGELETQLILEMAPLQRFNNVVGQITVSYDGAGSLQGVGGSVEEFEVSFTPEDLLAKPNPNDAEHINIASISSSGSLIKIYYTNAQNGGDHIEVSSILVNGALTYIGDL